MLTSFSDVVRVYKVNSLDSAHYTREVKDRGLAAGFAISFTAEPMGKKGSMHRVYSLDSDLDRKTADGRFSVDHTYTPVMVGSEKHKSLLQGGSPGMPSYFIECTGKWDAEIVGYEEMAGEQLLVILNGRVTR